MGTRSVRFSTLHESCFDKEKFASEFRKSKMDAVLDVVLDAIEMEKLKRKT